MYRVLEVGRWNLDLKGFGHFVRLEALRTCSVADSWHQLQLCGLDQVCGSKLLGPRYLAYCVPGLLGLLFARSDRKLSNSRHLSVE